MGFEGYASCALTGSGYSLSATHKADVTSTRNRPRCIWIIAFLRAWVARALSIGREHLVHPGNSRAEKEEMEQSDPRGKYQSRVGGTPDEAQPKQCRISSIEAP